MKVDRQWWMVCVTAAVMAAVGGLTGCKTQGAASATGDEAVNPQDPTARAFSGTIISLRPFTATMKIAKPEHMGKDVFLNDVIVKYDANTKFLLDGAPATLDQIRQYMTVSVSGHMRGPQMFAERADFSSVLPKNVVPASRPAETALPPAATAP